MLLFLEALVNTHVGVVIIGVNEEGLANLILQNNKCYGYEQAEFKGESVERLTCFNAADIIAVSFSEFRDDPIHANETDNESDSLIELYAKEGEVWKYNNTGKVIGKELPK